MPPVADQRSSEKVQLRTEHRSPVGNGHDPQVSGQLNGGGKRRKCLAHHLWLGMSKKICLQRTALEEVHNRLTLRGVSAASKRCGGYYPTGPGSINLGGPDPQKSSFSSLPSTRLEKVPDTKPLGLKAHMQPGAGLSCCQKSALARGFHSKINGWEGGGCVNCD